jgi:hypothetical protein
MQVKVHMLAFGEPNEIRWVEIPQEYHGAMGDEEVLSAVFHYGQNEFQEQLHPSVSVGDVIELNDGDLFIVKPIGFSLMSKEEFNSYLEVPQPERMLRVYGIIV